jgi:hypothetical protein
MTSAHGYAYTPEPGAPYGMMWDKDLGAMRPRKKPPGPGFPRRKPAPATVKAVKPEDAPGPDEDVAPGARREPPGKRRSHHKQDVKPVGMPPPGRITKGVNKLYRRAGKMVRAVDDGIGDAFILAATNTADPGDGDDSVGAAWEEVARTNPRVRAALVRLLAGGAYGALLEAHLPIVAAIVIKERIRKHIPFGKLLASMAEPDEDTPPGQGGLPFGMTMDDMAQAAQVFAQNMPPGFAEQFPYPPGSMPQPQEGPPD